ncbi:MAG: SDR family oxidoreductase, partial [Chloroflexi bacterium]|nr:SDR family oxidoreductase [Chloroflexota bacterium]
DANRQGLEMGKHQITCNAVAPGLTDISGISLWSQNPEYQKAFISQVPPGRLAAPGEIADAGLFIASDQARATPSARGTSRVEATSGSQPRQSNSVSGSGPASGLPRSTPVISSICCFSQRSKGSSEAAYAAKAPARSLLSMVMMKTAPPGNCCRYQLSWVTPMRRLHAAESAARGPSFSCATRRAWSSLSGRTGKATLRVAIVFAPFEEKLLPGWDPRLIYRQCQAA